MARLRVLGDDDQFNLIDLQRDGVLGRDPEIAYIVDHPTVSRRHAEFRVNGEEVELRDLGSANGSFVNGRALDKRACMLEHGDQVQFGAVLATFYSGIAEAETTLRRGPAGRGSKTATQSVGSLLEIQMRLGRLAQRRMLVDRPPHIPGYELGHVLLPALGVGGDFIHWGLAADGRHALVVGDVCGKGVPAALYMAYVSGMLVQIVPHEAGALAILDRCNRALYQIMEPGMFVTAFAMLVDPVRHRVEMGCAGHAAAVIKRLDQPAGDAAIAPGLALGLAAQTDVGLAELDLVPGDVLTITTDGVDEARNAAAEEFGRWRVHDIASRAAGAIDTARRLQAAVNRHAAGVRQHDDITLVSLERV